MRVQLSVARCAYNGGGRQQIKAERREIELGSGGGAAGVAVTISLTMSEYMHMLGDECCLEFTAYAFVADDAGSSTAADGDATSGGQTFSAEEKIYLQPPPLFVSFADKKAKLVVDAPTKLKVGFTNPLPIPLTGVVLAVDGAKQADESESQPDIGANETAEHSCGTEACGIESAGSLRRLYSRAACKAQQVCGTARVRGRGTARVRSRGMYG